MENIKTQGISLPKLGLGTFRMQGDACRAAVESALELGYRHLDTAEMYGNEEAIGAALAASKVARKDLHVTTKVWNENLAPDAIRRAFDASLKKLRLDHVDLYLVHWPARNMNLPAMFETLMKLKEEGRTRAIGVANFNIALLKTVVEEIKAPIACNQVEYHVMLDQTPLRNYLTAKSIPLVAYCPLAQGRVASDEALAAIGRKHNASAAQVALKWLLDQDGVAAIPKASRAESQQANLDALKVQLDDADRKAIAALPKDKRCVNPGLRRRGIDGDSRLFRPPELKVFATHAAVVQSILGRIQGRSRKCVKPLSFPMLARDWQSPAVAGSILPLRCRWRPTPSSTPSSAPASPRTMSKTAISAIARMARRISAVRPRCWPACRSRPPAFPSTASARRACRPSRWPPTRSARTAPIASSPAASKASRSPAAARPRN